VARAEEAIRCQLGDVEEYLALERRLSEERAERPSRTRRVADALAGLKPGDVIRVRGRGGGLAAVISVSWRRGGVQARVVTTRRNRLTLGADDFDEPPRRLGSIPLPEPYAPNSQHFIKETGSRLARARVEDVRDGDEDDAADEGMGELARRVEEHPVAACADLQAHRRGWAQRDRLVRERRLIERQVRGHSGSLARQFDDVLQLLEDRGYLDGWSLTEAGEQLARLYHEADLLIAECLREGLLDGLDAPTLAGVVSTFTYETRGPGDGPVPWFPSAEARRRWARIEAVHGALRDDEERARLPVRRDLDPGFVALAHAWAAGDDLDAVLEDEELSGGDFVRNVKQLIDLLRQLADVADVPATAAAAGEAADALHRGVVAASSVLGGGAP
jgi:ATP-dependent RNA helicase HelY